MTWWQILLLPVGVVAIIGAYMAVAYGVVGAWNLVAGRFPRVAAGLLIAFLALVAFLFLNNHDHGCHQTWWGEEEGEGR